MRRSMPSSYPETRRRPKPKGPKRPLARRTQWCRGGLVSAVDGRHVGVVVACAGGGPEVVEPFELRFGELDLVSQGVLLDASDAAGAGDRGDVFSAREDPGERGL